MREGGREARNRGQGGSLSPKLAYEEESGERNGPVVKKKEGFILGEKEII